MAVFPLLKRTNVESRIIWIDSKHHRGFWGWYHIFHFHLAWISIASEALQPTFRDWWKLWRKMTSCHPWKILRWKTWMLLKNGDLDLALSEHVRRDPTWLPFERSGICICRKSWSDFWHFRYIFHQFLSFQKKAFVERFCFFECFKTISWCLPPMASRPSQWGLGWRSYPRPSVFWDGCFHLTKKETRKNDGWYYFLLGYNMLNMNWKWRIQQQKPMLLAEIGRRYIVFTVFL